MLKCATSFRVPFPRLRFKPRKRPSDGEPATLCPAMESRRHSVQRWRAGDTLSSDGEPATLCPAMESRQHSVQRWRAGDTLSSDGEPATLCPAMESRRHSVQRWRADDTLSNKHLSRDCHVYYIVTSLRLLSPRQVISACYVTVEAKILK